MNEKNMFQVNIFFIVMDNEIKSCYYNLSFKLIMDEIAYVLKIFILDLIIIYKLCKTFETKWN